MSQSAATLQAELVAALSTVASVRTGCDARTIPPDLALPVIAVVPLQDEPKNGIPVQRFRQEWTRTVGIEIFFAASADWHNTADVTLNAVCLALGKIKGGVVRLEQITWNHPAAGDSASLQIRCVFEYGLQLTE